MQYFFVIVIFIHAMFSPGDNRSNSMVHRCLEGIRIVSGFWKVFGGYLEGVWKASGGSPEGV